MKKSIRITALILCLLIVFQTFSASADAFNQETNIQALDPLSGLSEKLGYYFSSIVDLKDAENIVTNDGDDNTVTLEMNDGTRTAYSFSEPVKYKNDSGETVFKDTIINNIGSVFHKKQYEYSNVSNNYNIGFSNEYRSGVKVDYSGATFSIGAVTSDFNLWSKIGYRERDKSGKSVIDKFSYSNLYGLGTKLSYIPQLNGVKQEIVLNKYRDQNKFSFEIITDGCYAKCDDDNIIRIYKNGTNEKLHTFSAPFAYDSQGQEGVYDDHFTDKCSYELQKITDNSYYLNLTVDEDWLKADTTKYPVTIDPTTSEISSSVDVPVHSKRKTAGAGKDNNFVGRTTSFGNSRFYVKFPIPSAIKSYATVNSAGYYARELTVRSGSMQVSVHKVSGSWSNNTIYSTQPKFESSYVTKRSISTGNVDKDSYWYRFNVKTPIQKWVNGETNYGLVFKSVLEGGTTYDYRSFANLEYSTSGMRPYTLINYTNDTTAPTASVAKSTSGWTNASVKLTVTASDSGSGLAAKPYKFGSAAWQSGKTYNVDKNISGLVVQVKDKAGNVKKITVNVNNIDRTAPTFSVNREYDTDSKEYTITVNAADSGSGLNSTAYSFGGGSWISQNSITLSESVRGYSIKVRDVAGNVRSTAIDAVFDNADPEKPGIYEDNGYIIIIPNGDRESADSDEIGVFNGTVEYKVNDGDWNVYSGFCDVPRDSDVVISARVKDFSGNVSEVATKTFKSLLGVYEFTADDITFSNILDGVTVGRKYSSTEGWKCLWMSSGFEDLNDYAKTQYRVFTDLNGDTVILQNNDKNSNEFTDGTYVAKDVSSATLGSLTLNQALVKVTDDSSTVYYYEPSGKIKAIKDKKDNYLLFDFNSNAVTVTDSQGNTTVVALDNGKIASVTDELGKTVTYNYEGGRLKSVVDGANVVLESYTYNSNGKIVKNGAETVSYDSNGRIANRSIVAKSSADDTASDNYDKEIYTYGSDDEGNYFKINHVGVSDNTYYYNNQCFVIKVVDSNGKVTDEEKSNSSKLVNKTTDASGNTYYRNSDNSLQKIEYADGKKAVYEYENSNEYKITLYYPDNRIEKVTHVSDSEEEYNIYTYDDNNNLLNVTYADGTEDVYTYNSDNKLVSVVYADSSSETYTYDDSGRKLSVVYSDGTEEHYTYNENGTIVVRDENNKVVSVIDSDGNESQNTYDDNDTKVVKDKDGNTVEIIYKNGKTETFLYDSFGNVIREKDVNNNYTYYLYDHVNREIGRKVVYSETLASSTAPVNYNDVSTYDEIYITVYNARGYVVSENSNGVLRTYTYDNGGRLLKVEKGSDITVSYVYDSLGNATSLTDVTGTVSYVYNEVGRVLKATLPNGRIIYYYYTNDKPSKVTMDGYEIVYSSSGKVLSFSINGVPVQQSNYADIDSKELLQSVVYANGVTRSYEYNSDGSVSRITLGNGSVKYEYDSEGNLTEVLDEENLIKYIFRTETTSTEDEDAEENKRNYVDVCVENDEDWIVLYSYEVDEDGALLQFGTSLFSYTDNNSYLQSGTVKYRQQTVNNYNGNVYLRNVSKKALDTGVESTLYLQEFTYFSNGLVKSEKITLANGTEMLYNYTYDEEQRLSSVSLNGVIQSTFEYDVNGWLKDDKNFANGVRYVYSYNTDGNLKARYVYYLQTDGSWKLVGAHPHKYDTTYRDEVLTGYNETYTYDEAGNPLTYFKQSTMTWNGNELASYSNGTTTATYSYVDGLRTKKVVNGVTYLYSWQDDRLVSQVKLNENVQIAEKLVFWYDESNNLIGFVYNDTDVYTYVRNQLGDIVYILDNNGQIVVTYQYLATGRVYSITDTTSNKIGTINPFRYRGYYYDNESKMYYLKARYYCPDLMRFLSPDAPEYLDTNPATSRLPLNLYAYCLNDPVDLTDDYGHAPFKMVGVGIQIEISLGGASGGIEVIWFFSSQVNVGRRSRKTPYVYLYGGIGVGQSAKTRKVLESMIKKPSLLFNPKSLVSGFSLSVCVFAVFGYSNFKSPSNYLKSFSETYGTWWHVKAYTSWSNYCFVVGVGWSSAFANAGYTKSYYKFSKTVFKEINNLYSKVFKKAKKIKR